MNRRTMMVTAAVLLGTALAVFFWPAGDPLAGAEAVALTLSDAGASEEAAGQGMLIRGLTVVLEERGITMVEDPAEADILLEISEVRLEEAELTLGEGGLSGKLSATCLATDLRTGEAHRLFLYVTLEDGVLKARLVTRKFWQFWR